MPERDYPVGHPAAPDYKGQPYRPNRAPFEEDFPVGHPARNGGNVSDLDRPDGQRAAHLKQSQNLQVLAMIGSLPRLIDDATGKEVELTPQELAHIYAVRKALPTEIADEMTKHYGLEPLARAEDVPEQTSFSAQEQAVMILIKRGYSPERAKVLIDKYGVPDTLREHEADAHK